MEAYTNLLSPAYTDRYAEQAVKLIFDNLETAYRDGTDIHARQQMQLAAFFAGAAFTRACVGYVHAIAHTLGGLYGTPHGLANAVILPYVLEDFGPAVYSACKAADIVAWTEEPREEKAKAFIAEIRRMNRDMTLLTSSISSTTGTPQMIGGAKEAKPSTPSPSWGKDEMAPGTCAHYAHNGLERHGI